MEVILQPEWIGESWRGNGSWSAADSMHWQWTRRWGAPRQTCRGAACHVQQEQSEQAGGSASTAATLALLIQRRGFQQQELWGAAFRALQPEAEGQAQQAWEFQAAARQLEQVLRCLLEEWLGIDCPRAGARTVIDGPRDWDRLAALMAASGPSFASSAYCRHCQGSDRAVGAKQKGKLLKCRVATANAVQEWGRLRPSLQRWGQKGW